MDDLLAQLEHLEKQATDCELISRLAIEAEKRDMFQRLSAQYRAMAESVRREIAKQRPQM